MLRQLDLFKTLAVVVVGWKGVRVGHLQSKKVLQFVSFRARRCYSWSVSEQEGVTVGQFQSKKVLQLVSYRARRGFGLS